MNKPITDTSKLIGSRGVRVNVFASDNEQDIALRLIRAVIDEYFEPTEKDS